MFLARPPRGRSKGRAAAFGESAFLRAASDIGGPLRGLFSSPFDSQVYSSDPPRPAPTAGRKGKKTDRAGGREVPVVCVRARACACDRLGAHMLDL